MADSEPWTGTPANGLPLPFKRTTPVIGLVGPKTSSNVAPTTRGSKERLFTA